MPFLGVALSFITGGFSKLFAMIPAFLRWCLANPAWVLCAALGVVLLFAKADARHWHKQSDQNAAALTGEIAKNKVNLASIATLQGALDEKNAESDARAKALTDSRAQNDADTKRLDALAKADRSRTQALEALRAGHVADPHCAVPAALAAQLSGL